LLVANHVDGEFNEVADHAVHIAPVVADLGELGGLDLDERGADELGESTGNFGFAHAGGADEEHVGRGDLGADILRELLASPAIAHGDRRGALGGVLADNMPVQRLNDFLRGHFNHG
jgi:hypothetical protein